VLTVVLILASPLAILGLRRDAITDAEDDNHRLGVVLAEQTTRTFSVWVSFREILWRQSTAPGHMTAPARTRR
jgi:hypothetical protein